MTTMEAVGSSSMWTPSNSIPLSSESFFAGPSESKDLELEFEFERGFSERIYKENLRKFFSGLSLVKYFEASTTIT